MTTKRESVVKKKKLLLAKLIYIRGKGFGEYADGP